MWASSGSSHPTYSFMEGQTDLPHQIPLLWDLFRSSADSHFLSYLQLLFPWVGFWRDKICLKSNEQGENEVKRNDHEPRSIPVIASGSVENYTIKALKKRHMSVLPCNGWNAYWSCSSVKKKKTKKKTKKKKKQTTWFHSSVLRTRQTICS